MTDTELLNAIIENSWDVRCISAPTGGDDYDIQWIVIEHYQAEPNERVVGRSFSDDPREAIMDALANQKKHVDCHDGCQFSEDVSMSEYSCEDSCYYAAHR